MAILCGYSDAKCWFRRHFERGRAGSPIVAYAKEITLQISLTVDDATLVKIVVFLVLLLH